jgi:hypothetical protein
VSSESTAGHRAARTCGANDAQRDAFGEHQVEQSVLKPRAPDGQTERQLDRPDVRISFDRFVCGRRIRKTFDSGAAL